MSRIIRLVALSLFTALSTEPLCAEQAAGPPAWNDGRSVYLEMAQRNDANDAPAKIETATTVAKPQAEAQLVDHSVTPAVHEAAAPAAPATDDRRRLAPPSARVMESRGNTGSHGPSHSHAQDPNSASRRLADFGVPASSMYKIGTGLAIVIGAFLIFAWAMRRSGRTAAGRANLPADVVSVLGRVPLAARQFAELLRVGNKLVLVSLTPNGAEPITEVTDPAEVDRLLGLCQQSNPHSTTKAFEQVFRQLSNEPAPSGFLGNDPMPTSFASPAASYRAHRGDMSRG
jgi:flagellar biogenesis protein FliO